MGEGVEVGVCLEGGSLVEYVREGATWGLKWGRGYEAGGACVCVCGGGYEGLVVVGGV